MYNVDGFNSIYNNNSATSRFTEVFTSVDTFITSFRESPLNDANLTDETLKKVFYELVARYGDSYFKSTNDYRNKLKTFSILSNEGVVYQKKLEIQKNLINLTLQELMDDGVSISNYAENPGDEATTTIDAYEGEDFLKYVNNQSVNKAKSNKLNAYKSQLYAIRDVTTAFIERFSELFETILWSSYLPIYEY